VQGLLLKLAEIDSEAERGVRLIEFFDQLVVHGADLEAVVRATAVLAEATAGASHGGTGMVSVVGPDGLALPSSDRSKSAIMAEVRIDGEPVGQVWLERPDGAHEWDELILDRMALTVAATQSRASREGPAALPQLGLSDPAIVQALLDPGATEVERSRAVRLLGFAPGQMVDVIAAQTATDMNHALAQLRTRLHDETGRHAVGTALSDTLGILILAAGQLSHDTIGVDLHACVADRVPVEAVPRAWRAARQGVRFAPLGAPWPTVTRVSDLGSLVLLADLPAAAVLDSGDVRALSQIARRQDGGLDLRLLRAVSMSRSLRDAANGLHMHHSSAAYRLKRLSKALGFDVREGSNRYRLSTALLLWGLHGPPDVATVSLQPVEQTPEGKEPTPRRWG
jgi:hypothetical protein